MSSNNATPEPEGNGDLIVSSEVIKSAVHVKITGGVGQYRYEIEAWPSILRPPGTNEVAAELLIAQQYLLEETYSTLLNQVRTVDNELEAYVQERRQAASDGFDAPPQTIGANTTQLPAAARQAAPTRDRHQRRDWGLLRWKPRASDCNYGDIFRVIATEYIFPVTSGLDLYGPTSNQPLVSIRPGSPNWDNVFQPIFAQPGWQPTASSGRHLPLNGAWLITVMCSTPFQQGGVTKGITREGNPYLNPIGAVLLASTSYTEDQAVPPDSAQLRELAAAEDRSMVTGRNADQLFDDQDIPF